MTDPRPMTDGEKHQTPVRPPPLGEHASEMLTSMAAQLRRLRLEHSLRLVDAAERAGLSPAFLSRIEQEERLPSLEALVRLADVYGVPVASLLREPTPEWSVTHRAVAVWEGSEEHGSGRMRAGNDDIGLEYLYDRDSRLVGGDGRGFGSPEQLIGMGLAGCYSMSLARALARENLQPRWVETHAEIDFSASGANSGIRNARLITRADVSGVTVTRFREIADETRSTCVVARALAALNVTLDADLVAAE